MGHCTESPVYLRGQRREKAHNGALYSVQSIWGARGG
jgi:hypothetical protein